MLQPSEGNRKRPPEETASEVIIAYPTRYMFKIMGRADSDFPEHARKLVTEVVGRIPDERIVTRAGSRGKYQSVSVTAWLESEQQRRAIYQALFDDERVLYYF